MEYIPQKTPKSPYQSRWWASKGTSAVKLTSHVKSLIMYEVAKEQRHDTIRHMTASVFIGIFRTSSVNRAPPIGALKMPAMPAPAPHPTKIRTASGVSPNHLPMQLPIAPPEYAPGPSAPADPPNPTVSQQPIMGFHIRLFLKK